MITSIASTNKTAYSDLFRKASEELRKLSETDSSVIFKKDIQTLEEYFVWLPTLAQKLPDRSGRKYTILPLDEGYFEIDANSRKITIPADFKRNGIAVQGDRGAETIYFKINRYFDHQDLNECDIYIQWEEAGAISGRQKNSGVVPDFVRDIESDKDYLIFGWPILDDVTQSAGSIKFSIRFVKIHQEDGTPILDYSFSTLDAVATINPALDVDYELLQGLADGFEDKYDTIINSLTAAKRTGPQAASMPTYVMMLIDADGDFKSDAIDVLTDLNHQEVKPYVLDLDKNTGKIYIGVSAVSEDTGVISYIWKKDNEEYTGHDSIQYIPTKDSYPIGYKDYYNKDGEKLAIISDTTWEEVINDNDTLITDTADICEKCYVLEISKVGKYQSEIVNTYSDTNSKADNRSRIIRVPGPDMAQGLTEEITRIVLNAEEGTKTIDPELILAEDTDYDIKWYKGKDIASTEKTLSITINNETQGIYHLEAIGQRNNAVSDMAKSADYYITLPALPVNVEQVSAGTIYAGSGLKVGNELEVIYTLDDTKGYSQLSELTETKIQWYTGNDAAEPIPGATENKYTFTEAGNYSVKVTNIYNNDVQEYVYNFAINK